jgi:hypothetical protein
MRTLAFLALFAMAAFPAAAQSSTGTSDLQYYVGTWSCMGGAPGQQTTKATLTYTLDSGILYQVIDSPMQGKMKKAYTSSSSTTYDAKNDRFISAGVSNDPLSYTSMWTLAGNVETSRDLWVSNGKLGHGKTVRNSSSTFTYTGYPSMTAAKPDFEATCRRSS